MGRHTNEKLSVFQAIKRPANALKIIDPKKKPQASCGKLLDLKG